MLQAGIHVISTLRRKTGYMVRADEKGKSAPKKIVLAPVQREGMAYEFTVFLDLAKSTSPLPPRTAPSCWRPLLDAAETAAAEE